MSVTYQIEPVLETVREFIDSSLTTAGTPATVLPTLSAIAQYTFEPSLCPMLILEPVATSADWRHYAAGDVLLTLDLQLHEVRLRTGSTGGEEGAAIQVLCELATAFTTNYRLSGAVQGVFVESITVAEPSTLGHLGIPLDEHQLFAAATMKLTVNWVESWFITE